MNGFFGLELETFETTTVIKNSNLNRFIVVLTHLDLFKTWKSLKKAKKRIKDRLIQEANGNCKIFYCSGLKNNNGYFSGGPSSGVGIAPGAIRFSNNLYWENDEYFDFSKLFQPQL